MRRFRTVVGLAIAVLSVALAFYLLPYLASLWDFVFGTGLAPRAVELLKSSPLADSLILDGAGAISTRKIAVLHGCLGVAIIVCVVVLASLVGTLQMARRSVRQHAVSTIVTALSVALGCGLLMSVFVIKDQAFRAFTGADAGFDAVLGAKGSQLQLVLNSIYHLEDSPGNLPWSAYRQIAERPGIKEAIPLAVGDNYKGFRIVGTTAELFTVHEYEPGRKFEMAQGRVFDEHRREAVIGSFVARQTGLKVGDKFNTFHGLVYDEGAAHPDEFLVIGVMEPTNTPADRVLWVPLEGYYRMSGHAYQRGDVTYKPRPGQNIPDEYKEVSAVLLVFGNKNAGFMLSNDINKGTAATMAWPISQVVAQLFDRIAWVNKVLELVAYLVVVVAAGSILASVYNSMNERRREFAILRALGAHRGTVFTAIVVESGTIALLGAMLGFAVYFALLALAAWIIRTRTGIVIDVAAWHAVMIYCPLGMTALGAMSGIMPAIKAYSTDVAGNLSPIS